jgi:hypothetical protein
MVIPLRYHFGKIWEVPMAISLDPKQIVSSEELLMSQVVPQEAIIRLLVEKGIFSKEEFLKMVEMVNLEIGKMV